ncbi:efflux RND transporter periplasmic adaptor subunit [Colwellia psychrerythraea]|uniref:Efflux transporter, RND family, MFP subunit n=1 Tax=Colwellia psychrerythraea TaxID=28229 RepID=A0A099KWX3_COLPS|nr:efflux RND transporter periplasmic adaptor subunit [Colwellia psychrerythraea]KGJ94123.1 efflux transporter, RND family, MFP subunit [Colwellia psychrerythraea]
MIVILILFYSSFYFLFFEKAQWIKKTTCNISLFSGVGVVLIASVVFSWYTFSPISGDARVVRYVIPVVPNVKGQVLKVYVEPMTPIKKGSELFQIDPSLYLFNVKKLQAQIEQFKAQKKLAEINLARANSLVKTNAIAQSDVDTWQANKDIAVASINSTQASLDSAIWQLDETTVRAPHDGFVPNLQLRPGNYVTTIPLASSMAFVSDESSDIVASFSQSSIRRVDAGDEIEITFNTIPGKVFSGKIEKVIKVSSQAQLTATSTLPTLTGAPVNDRWGIRVSLDDEAFAITLPQGAAGTLAVYTSEGKALHIISKVTLRIKAWLAYLTSP